MIGSSASRNALRASIAVGAVLALSTGSFAQQTQTRPRTGAGAVAHAVIQGCDDSGISGTAALTERPSREGVKLVEVEIRVTGMKPGVHAVHIHEVAQCQPCGSAKGHFDPGPNSNSNPDGNHPFHMGDLINIEVNAQGEGLLRTTTSRVTISPGPLSVLDEDGSAFIIHVDPDTYCPEGVEKGCAGGARAACGIIERG